MMLSGSTEQVSTLVLTEGDVHDALVAYALKSLREQGPGLQECAEWLLATPSGEVRVALLKDYETAEVLDRHAAPDCIQLQWRRAFRSPARRIET